MREGIFVEADHDGEWFTGHVIAMHKGKWAVRFFTHCSMPFIISETIARHLVDPIVHVFKPERIAFNRRPLQWHEDLAVAFPCDKRREYIDAVTNGEEDWA